MALLDQVKKSLSSGFQLPQVGQSERIKQLQAGAAGRQVVGGEEGPQQGSMAEMVAAATARQQQQEDVAQGQVAAAGLEQQRVEQEQQFRQRAAIINEEVLNARQLMQNKTQDILQDYAQRRGELDFKEDSSRVQYALSSMRLSNDDYIDKLEVEAQRSRLYDDAGFEWELTQSMLADSMEMFKKDLTFKAAMNAEDREFNEYIAGFNIEQAITLAGIEAESKESQAQMQAVGGLVSAGISTVTQGAKEGWFDNKPDTTTGTFGGEAPLQSFQNKPTRLDLDKSLTTPSNPMAEMGYPAETLKGVGTPESRFGSLTNPVQLSELDTNGNT